jgi:hypothetical protein
MGDSGKALNLSVFVNTPMTVYGLIIKVYASVERIIKTKTLQEACLAQAIYAIKKRRIVVQLNHYSCISVVALGLNSL